MANENKTKEEVVEQFAKVAGQYTKHQAMIQHLPAQSHPCPNCGYCPHCGRGGSYYYPHFVPDPVYPSPWPHGTVIMSSGSQGNVS